MEVNSHTTEGVEGAEDYAAGERARAEDYAAGERARASLEKELVKR